MLRATFRWHQAVNNSLKEIKSGIVSTKYHFTGGQKKCVPGGETHLKSDWLVVDFLFKLYR